jgi:hypothetical protein
MANPFNPDKGSHISKEEAMAWIDKYDREMRKDKEKDTKSIFFGKDVLAKMLKGKSAGISIFLGLRYSEFARKEVVNLILVPTTEDGSLLWEASSATALESDDSGAFDEGFPCPPYCAK